MRVTLQMLCKTSRRRADRAMARQRHMTAIADCDATGAGTAILKAVETAIGCPVHCSTSLQYLLTLNHANILDCDEISAKLAITLLLPLHFSTTYNTQQARQEWLKPIITAAILDSLTTL